MDTYISPVQCSIVTCSRHARTELVLLCSFVFCSDVFLLVGLLISSSPVFDVPGHAPSHYRKSWRLEWWKVPVEQVTRSARANNIILIHSLYFPVDNGDNIRNLAQDRGHQAATERRRFKPAARTGPSDIGHNLWLRGRQSNGSKMQGEWLQFA